MTPDGIDYNLKRLEFFLNFPGHIPRSVKEMSDLKVLFEGYSRLMDIYGGGKEQYSLLLLVGKDFDEMHEYAKTQEEYKLILSAADDLPTSPQVFALALITFRAYHYTWWIKKTNSYEIL